MRDEWEMPHVRTILERQREIYNQNERERLDQKFIAFFKLINENIDRFNDFMKNKNDLEEENRLSNVKGKMDESLSSQRLLMEKISIIFSQHYLDIDRIGQKREIEKRIQMIDDMVKKMQSKPNKMDKEIELFKDMQGYLEEVKEMLEDLNRNI